MRCGWVATKQKQLNKTSSIAEVRPPSSSSTALRRTFLALALHGQGGFGGGLDVKKSTAVLQSLPYSSVFKPNAVPPMRRAALVARRPPSPEPNQAADRLESQGGTADEPRVLNIVLKALHMLFSRGSRISMDSVEGRFGAEERSARATLACTSLYSQRLAQRYNPNCKPSTPIL